MIMFELWFGYRMKQIYSCNWLHILLKNTSQNIDAWHLNALLLCPLSFEPKGVPLPFVKDHADEFGKALTCCYLLAIEGQFKAHLMGESALFCRQQNWYIVPCNINLK